MWVPDDEVRGTLGKRLQVRPARPSPHIPVRDMGEPAQVFFPAGVQQVSEHIIKLEAVGDL